MIYNILYVGLDGTTNSNAATYDDSGADLTLVAPTDLGDKTFLGWFSDTNPSITEVTVIDSTLAAALADGSDITIYALFVEIEMVGDYWIIPQTGTIDRATNARNSLVAAVTPKRLQNGIKGGHYYKLQVVITPGTQIYLLDVFGTKELALEARDAILLALSA